MDNPYLAWSRERFGRLQNGFLKSSRYRKDMARLRACLASPVGSDWDAAKWSLAGMPAFRDRRRMEAAAWLGFALYATHQQGVHDMPMHVEGVCLSSAISRLVSNGEDVERLVARMRRAESLDELRPLAVALVRRLRDARIGFDYGFLVEDLFWFGDAAGRDRVSYWWKHGLTYDHTHDMLKSST